uniref:ATP synthase F0 subunit 6 n=1 Tax=Paruterina candelabraria TaxID=2364639 RepID=A0A386HV59_9CEST|nr:ATP synthase F0 subunit 6 [Paruterina candelabraria]AYD49582.1 ATP synthase F0 subunit 6 [Paruterina candelabraria]
MFNVINDSSSVISYIYSYFVLFSPYYYFFPVFFLLFMFLCYRVPYCYSPYLFCSFLVVVLLISFSSLFLCRFVGSISVFFSTFIPVGTPIYICFLVCVAETISYVIRPIVLILRPFINISLGCLGGVSLGNLCFDNLFWLLVLFILFLYEVFVALVHWYIVVSILSFSVDH